MSGPIRDAPYESTAPSLTQGDIERFSRQIILEGIGAEGMERIRRASILCVGAGGLGSTAILYLAAAGVGKLIIVDGDQVERSNLHRQVIHHVDGVGVNKAQSAKDACQRLHPFTEVEVVPQMLTLSNAETIMRRCDIVVDGTDNVAARYIINDAAMRCELPVVSGSAMRWEGQLSVYGWQGGPCYRCLFPSPPPAEAVGSCNETGVLGPIPGLIGCLQAMETLKIISGAGSTLAGKMFVFDGLSFSSRVVTLRQKQASCVGCGPEAMTNKSLSDALEAHPEYQATSCTTQCRAPVLLPEQQCSPSVLVSMTSENESMLQEALSAVRQLQHWYLCVDVRNATQFDMVRLPGSVSLPYDTLRQWEREGELVDRWTDFILSTLMLDIMRHSQLEDVGALLPPRCTIYFVCRRGINSVKAIQLLNITLATQSTNDRMIEWSLKNIEGGLNAYHRNIEPSFPFY
eukprot:gene8400-5881_t